MVDQHNALPVNGKDGCARRMMVRQDPMVDSATTVWKHDRIP
jgi:hypothetical protein